MLHKAVIDSKKTGKKSITPFCDMTKRGLFYTSGGHFFRYFFDYSHFEGEIGHLVRYFSFSA